MIQLVGMATAQGRLKCFTCEFNTMIKIPQYNFYKITTYALLLIICGMVGYRVMDLRKVFATVPVSYITWNKLQFGDPYYNTPLNIGQDRQAGDVNGDSLIDILDLNDGYVFLNIGNGFGSGGTHTTSLASLVSLPTFWRPDSIHAAGIKVVDINSDGLADILQKVVINSVVYQGVYINTGYGWEKDSRYSIPVTFATQDWEYNVPLIDLNGDGLLEILFLPNNDEFYLASPAQ